MMNNDSKQHWENVYHTKQPNEVSWTQTIPQTSLNFIRGFNLPKDAAIIDIGGGDSRLVDFLLDDGYENISVLDISAAALDRAKARLGECAANVKWIVADITEFRPETKYAVWHDRAVFHFLTTDEQINTYLTIAKNSVTDYLVIATFSENGPQKCSGLDIKQYSETTLEQRFADGFKKMQCLIEDHITPFDTVQNFVFCSFRREGKEALFANRGR